MTAVSFELRGTCASPGFAHGPLHVLDDAPAPRQRIAGDAGHEAAALRSALAHATRELGELMAQATEPDGRDLLEFQMAMLEDETLVQPPYAAIESGTPADRAWSDALDELVNEYRTAADPYFAARAADLEDMRDRVLRAITGASASVIPPGAIVVATDLAPSRFLEIPWRDGGIALFAGSAQSHTATLARARGVPMIVGMTPAPPLPPGDVVLDAAEGVLIAAPSPAAMRAFEARRRAARTGDAAEERFRANPATTADGERVRVQLNVAHIDDLATVDPAWTDGIGLVRTELMLRGLAELRDEDYQFSRYRAIVAWARGRPVTFRTLDAGGDKPIDGYTLAGEANPFLGLRGVRLSLHQPELLVVQLRALARAAAAGAVNVMIPMITVSGELDRVRSLLNAAVADLRASGIPCGDPRLGMMVEVPAAALTLDTFAADFFSIGSNDLIAYTMAAGRDSDRLAQLCDPLQPAVLRLIGTILAGAAAAKCEVSLCGDMASDTRALPALLAMGLRSFSVAPGSLGKVKAAIGAFTAAGRG